MNLPKPVLFALAAALAAGVVALVVWTAMGYGEIMYK